MEAILLSFNLCLETEKTRESAFFVSVLAERKVEEGRKERGNPSYGRKVVERDKGKGGKSRRNRTSDWLVNRAATSFGCSVELAQLGTNGG